MWARIPLLRTTRGFIFKIHIFSLPYKHLQVILKGMSFELRHHFRF
jgi:hypothetical protein